MKQGDLVLVDFEDGENSYYGIGTYLWLDLYHQIYKGILPNGFDIDNLRLVHDASLPLEQGEFWSLNTLVRESLRNAIENEYGDIFDWPIEDIVHDLQDCDGNLELFPFDAIKEIVQKVIAEQ